MLIISDASIKNNVVILILHICRDQEIIAINMTSLKVELFAI